MATVAELTAERNSLERDLATALAELARLQQGRGRPSDITTINAVIADLRAALAINQTALAQATSAAKPIDNAGAQTINEQNARANTANTQSPEKPAAVQTSTGRVTSELANPTTSNAQRYNPTSAADSGTNSATRPITSTQAIPGNYPGTIQNPNQLPPAAPIPTSTPGVGAGGDDKATAIRNRLTQIYAGKNLQITPQPNALAKYSSYTYNISIYIMSPAEYRKIIKNKKVNIPGSNLLIQSGGMPYTSGNPTPSDAGVPTSVSQIDTNAAKTAEAGRNQFFPLDYYIDGLKMTGLQPGKGTNSSHNITQISFKIVLV